MTTIIAIMMLAVIPPQLRQVIAHKPCNFVDYARACPFVCFGVASQPEDPNARWMVRIMDALNREHAAEPNRYNFISDVNSPDPNWAQIENNLNRSE